MVEINLTEYLTRVLNDDQWIYEDACGIVAGDDSSVDDKLLLDIMSKLHERKERDPFWENLLDYLPQKSLSQNVFDYLLKNKIGLIRLAHMDLDDNKLKKLVMYAEEALFTLAKRYYGKKEYSVADFASFLCEYKNGTLLEQLGFIKPDNPKKGQILFYFYSKDKEYQSEIKKLIESKYLEITNDSSIIQVAYESNEPLYSLALSKNIFASIDILDALTNISGVENASYIRKNSRETLSLKKYIDNKMGDENKMRWKITGYEEEEEDDEEELPEDVRYYYCGRNLLDAGKFNEALESFRKSLELCNHFKTLERISDCYDMLGLAEPALKYIELAYQANPCNDNTAYKCAEKLKSDNRITEAREILESIILRSPSYKKAKILLQILDNGGLPSVR